MWRQPSADLPDFLQRRPAIFRECLKKPFSACLSIDTEDVTTHGGGTFDVQGAGNAVHSIEMGANVVVPTCTCTDFRRQRRLCKHILAVLHLRLWSWDQLPQGFRDSAFLNVDTEALGISQQAEATVQEVQQHEEMSGKQVTAAAPSAWAIPAAVDTVGWTLDSAAKHVRTVLSQIRSLTYSTTSVEALVRAGTVIEQVEKLLIETHPKDAGIEVAPPQTVHGTPTHLLETHSSKKKRILANKKGNITVVCIPY